MSACSVCKAPIEWVIVAKSGRSMPLDPVSVDDGNVVMTGSEMADRFGKMVPSVEVLPQQALSMDDRPRFKSHHATCPNADEFRKGKK